MSALTNLILSLLVALAPTAQAAGCTCAPDAQEERSCGCCCGDTAGGAGCGCCEERHDGPAAAWGSCDCVHVQPQSGVQATDEVVPDGAGFAVPAEAPERLDRVNDAGAPARTVLPPGFLLPLLV
jgi:hypothetical protein